MKALEGRIGIVTGGSSGIGYAISNVLAEAGATVYAVSRTGKVKDGMPASALGVIHVQGDVTNDARMREIVEQASGKQSLDFLVNNAGITKKCRAEDFPAEDFAHILQVNIHSVFRLCQLCYPYLKNSRHKGRIVSISSMAAHLGFTEVVPYCTSKAAVCGMTRGLAVEWANDNLCVNSIAPGWFPSEMSKQVMTPERKAAILGRMPVHAFGDTRDLGEMTKFLLSDGAKYITGQDFAVDGGALAYGF
ncbi:SDR family oxidoreductase [Agathobaculum sp. NSJ-28]|uniref:SDR family oxidoreductase n=2 Tax=Agathobaculum TaxID=2048137 RepID=A0A923LYU7_9FIRM|nr:MULTISPECIES: SDR family oxidoreductase [Butyricicoccaceae]MBS6884038.1 SDR family oxidoreductase [Clostridiaceae bacterium]SCJ51451.1 3-oxoacyl-[acyl-carrier-protein] reductase FabG [uncultured Butyricicoccus sp.]MBC5726580.1 SDR family oxidoreductase [Agathobaculum faecis]MCU6790125.1 SDR family oxidoreductase [Agathobaculum ammoniilyticum]WOC74911.1 SDR family oxidoreductase [Intestinibacillus sp. NTUH-41-i26]